ncbi:MAG: energy-coupling factor ABC transporter ATP-binding protein [Propioniciclava sp.]
MIDLIDVSYTYPGADQRALTEVSLRVPPGTLAGILGASGSGRTTLARVVAGFLPHADGGDLTGTATVAGHDLTAGTLLEAVSRVGLVTQNPFNQISGARYTVRGEIAFGLENIGTPRQEMVARVDEVADLLQITGLLDRSPYELSGGQQQLVAIASMIVLRTPVLVMDEPTAHLDPAGTRLVFEVLSRLRATGTTIVIVEDQLELLHQAADQLHVLVGGAIVASGDPSTLLADPRMPAWGVGTTRYTRAARLARAEGLLPHDAPLPVSLAQARATFAPGRSA